MYKALRASVSREGIEEHILNGYKMHCGGVLVKVLVYMRLG